jgi:hypothetical protein
LYDGKAYSREAAIEAVGRRWVCSHEPGFFTGLDKAAFSTAYRTTNRVEYSHDQV